MVTRGWTTGSGCCPRAAAATCPSASGRCAARSTGATTCSTPTSRRLFARLVGVRGRRHARDRRGRVRGRRRRDARPATSSTASSCSPSRASSASATTRTATAGSSMLETIREYAAERLGGARASRSSTRSAIATRGRTSRSPRRPPATLELGGPRHHARPARGRPRQPPDRHRPRDRRPRTASRRRASCGPCSRFWHMRGHLVEGRARSDAVLAMTALDRRPVARPPAGARGRGRARLLGG